MQTNRTLTRTQSQARSPASAVSHRNAGLIKPNDILESFLGHHQHQRPDFLSSAFQQFRSSTNTTVTQISTWVSDKTSSLGKFKTLDTEIVLIHICALELRGRRCRHSQRCWIFWFAFHQSILPPAVQRCPGAPRPSCGCSPCRLLLLLHPPSVAVCHSLSSPPNSGSVWPFLRKPLPPFPRPCPHHSPPSQGYCVEQQEQRPE